MKKVVCILLFCMGEIAAMVPAHWSDECILDAAVRYDISRIDRLLKETGTIDTEFGIRTVNKYTIDDDAHNHGCTPLIAALHTCSEDEKEKRYEMIQFLLKRGARPYRRSNDKNYPIIQAAKIGALREAALLLEAHGPYGGREEDERETPHVDVQDSTLRTPLMHAAGSTRIENFYQEVAEISDAKMVLLLLLYDADYTKETKEGTGKTAEKFAANDEIKTILSDPPAFKKKYPKIIEEIEQIKQRARLDWNRIQIAQRGGMEQFLRKRALTGATR